MWTNRLKNCSFSMKVTEKCSEAIKKKVNSADVLTTVRPTVLQRQPLVPMFYGPLLKNKQQKL